MDQQNYKENRFKNFTTHTCDILFNILNIIEKLQKTFESEPHKKSCLP